MALPAARHAVPMLELGASCGPGTAASPILLATIGLHSLELTYGILMVLLASRVRKLPSYPPLTS